MPGLEKIEHLEMLGPKKLKLHFTMKGATTDYDTFNSGFQLFKNEGILVRIWKRIKMFVELSNS